MTRWRSQSRVPLARCLLPCCSSCPSQRPRPPPSKEKREWVFFWRWPASAAGRARRRRRRTESAATCMCMCLCVRLHACAHNSSGFCSAPHDDLSLNFANEFTNARLSCKRSAASIPCSPQYLHSQSVILQNRGRIRAGAAWCCARRLQRRHGLHFHLAELEVEHLKFGRRSLRARKPWKTSATRCFDVN